MRIPYLLLILLPSSAFSQHAYFHFTDGNSLVFPIEEIRSTGFIGAEMHLSLWNGTSHAWDLADISRYQFNDISTTVGEEAASPIGSLALYPNPSQGEFRIGFHVDTPGEVLIEILDTHGRLVASVQRGHFPAGDHTVIWTGTTPDGGTVSSGTYICRIVHGAQVVSKPLIVEN